MFQYVKWCTEVNIIFNVIWWVSHLVEVRQHDCLTHWNIWKCNHICRACVVVKQTQSNSNSIENDIVLCTTLMFCIKADNKHIFWQIISSNQTLQCDLMSIASGCDTLPWLLNTLQILKVLMYLVTFLKIIWPKKNMRRCEHLGILSALFQYVKWCTEKVNIIFNVIWWVSHVPSCVSMCMLQKNKSSGDLANSAAKCNHY